MDPNEATNYFASHSDPYLYFFHHMIVLHVLMFEKVCNVKVKEDKNAYMRKVGLEMKGFK